MTLQQLLGIELPIVQAPMAGVQGVEAVIAQGLSAGGHRGILNRIIRELASELRGAA